MVLNTVSRFIVSAENVSRADELVVNESSSVQAAASAAMMIADMRKAVLPYY